MRGLGATLGAAVALSAASARGDGPPPPRVALEWVAPAVCPSRADLVRRVEERSGPLALVAEGEAVHVAARVEPGPPFVGLVVVREEGRPPAERRLSASSCEELSDALALVVALALDARRRAGGSPPPSAAPAGAPVTGATPAATSRALPPPAPPAPPAPPGTPEPPARREAPHPERTVPLAWMAGGGVGFASGVAPSLSWGPRFQVSGGREWWRVVAWLASLEGGLHGASPGTVGYRLTEAAFAGCLDTSRRSGPWGFLGCVEGSAGTVRAAGYAGEGQTTTRTRHAPWGTLGPAGRLEFRSLEPVSLEVGARMAAALARTEFTLDGVGVPGTRVIHRTPGAIFGAHASLSLRWEPR